MVLALRLNISNIRMKPVEKGEVIYKLLEAKQMNPAIEADIDTIGKDLFGMKISMTYHCLNLYKKANNIPTIDRSRHRRRETNFDINNPNALDGIAQIFSYITVEHPHISSYDDCEKQLKKLKSIQDELVDYEKALLNFRNSLISQNIS